MRVLAIVAVVALAACGGGKKDNAPPLTKRQSDSVIGASVLPGAQGVRGALAIDDSAASRKKRLDSIAKADSL